MDIEKSTQDTACLGKTMFLCNKQQLSNIWGSIHKKVAQNSGRVLFLSKKN